MEQPRSRILRIHPGDNVAVAMSAVGAGEFAALGDGGVTAEQPIPFAHKIAIRPVSAGDAILKYGVPIGFATRGIAAGDWVHHHNLKSYFAAKKEES
jgi:altronate hydrolase